MKITRAAVLALLAALAARPALAAKKSAPEKTMSDKRFALAVPAGWRAQTESDGVALLGDPSKEGVFAQISVRFVPAGGKTAGAYLERLTEKPDVEMPGWKTGPVESVTVAGRPSRRVERDTSEFARPGSMRSAEVPMKETHVVVPAKKGGYFVLLYYVPRELDAKARPAFASLLKSFKPKL
jgi:hypothetical protein